MDILNVSATDGNRRIGSTSANDMPKELETLLFGEMLSTTMPHEVKQSSGVAGDAWRSKLSEILAITATTHEM